MKPNATTPKQNGGNILIREMELEDLPIVYSLGEELFTASEWPNLYRTWDQYELVNLFAGDGEFCLVAEKDDQIVGFALGSLIEKRHNSWRYGYLEWLGVSPALNRSGLGSRLFNRLTELFIESGCRMMLVDTEEENHPALNFFRKHGFKNEIGQIYLSRNLSNHPQYLKKKGRKTTHRKTKVSPRNIDEKPPDHTN